MVRAMKGALDFVLNDIRPDGSNEVYFFDLLPQFGETVGDFLRADLIELDFATDQLIEEVLGSVGAEFANTEGPNFHNILTTAGMVLLEGHQ